MNDDERDELLIRLDTKMDTAISRLNDHGQRLRSLEVMRNWVGGLGSGIGLVWAALKLHVKVSQGQ